MINRYFVLLSDDKLDKRIFTSQEEARIASRYLVNPEILGFKNYDDANKYLIGPKSSKKKTKSRYRTKAKSSNSSLIEVDTSKEIHKLLKEKRHETRGEALVEAKLNLIGLDLHGGTSKLLGKIGVKYLTQVEVKIKNYQHRFDFAIYDKRGKIRMFIEFDGRQHDEPVLDFGGETAFTVQKYKDNLKNEYCVSNGIELIRINLSNFHDAENIIRRQLKLLRRR